MAQLAYLIQENASELKEVRDTWAWAHGIIGPHDLSILQAMMKDLGRPHLETSLELGGIVTEVLFVIDHLEKWTTPRPVADDEMDPRHADWGLSILKQPRGVTLILSPWSATPQPAPDTTILIFARSPGITPSY